MALNSDAQGFLVGSKVDPSGFGEMDALKNDVRSIRKALQGRGDRDTPALPARSKPNRPDSGPAVAEVATPKRRGAFEPAGADLSEPSEKAGRDGPGAVGRVTGAASEAAKVVVNDEADASVKAFNEIAEPLKRGWSALRGGDSGEKQEGWLKRIFGALRGGKKGVDADGVMGERKREPTHFERSREHAVTRDASGRERDAQGRFVGNESSGGGTTAATRREVVPAPAGWDAGQGSGTTLPLRQIEQYLKSIDGKVVKPRGEGFLIGTLVTLAKFGMALIQWRREVRMDTNLDEIRDNTRDQLRVSTPFYAFVRRRLVAIGEAIEEPQHEGRGGFLAMLFAPLLAALAGLAAKLSGIPLLGAALGGLTRLLGGNVPPVAVPRSGRNTSGAPAPLPAPRTPSRWGRTQEGMRGNRALRTGRVAMRNAGRALRPVGRVLTRVPVLGSVLALGAGVIGARSIERDETLSREQKNAAQGKNWGGVGGGLAGALGGAALGTAIAGPIGTVVGGVLGAVLGDWLGGNLGEMMGARFSAFMAPVSAVFGEVRIWALATWDWIRDGASQFFDGTKAVFVGVGEWINERWGALIDTVTDAFSSFVGTLRTVLNALKDVPVLGDAIRAAEAAATTVAETARAAAEKAAELAGTAVDGVKATAGRVWEGVSAGMQRMIPQGIKDRVAHERALTTAENYRQGNISGLDDARTRELVASTVMTESAGGKLDTVNSAGYLGRYQAGAGWLADAGLIRGGSAAVQAAMKRDGFSNEYKWGQSGGMTRFLRNSANWAEGHSLEKYLASADIQDRAFRDNSSLAYQRMVKDGTITKAHTQSQIAGLLKARHIAGIGGARAVAAGGTGRRDANGTSARDYYNDVAGPGAQFAGAFHVGANAVARAPVSPVVASAKVPMPPPAPRASAIPDAPQVQVPLGSAGPGRPVVVQMPHGDAGQDVKDRGIAHIATGGLSRGG